MKPDALRIGVDDSLYDAVVSPIVALESTLGRIESDLDGPHHALRGLVAVLGDAGVLRHVIPARDGGTNQTVCSAAICLAREALGEISPLADLAFAMQGLGSQPIVLGAESSLRAEWLPRVAQGEAIAAFALTEPNAGTDLSGMETMARRDGQGYVLTGTKTFISNAPVATFFSVFAITAPSEAKRRVSAFVVPSDFPGVTVRPISVLGDHPIGDVRFDEVRVPETHRIGNEGDGMSLALGTLHRFRPTVGAAALGFGRRAFQESVRHVTTRRQFGAPLAELTAVQHRISDMVCDLEMATALVYRAALAIDRGDDRNEITRRGSMAKLIATEAAQRIVDSAVQLHGGYGVVRESVIARLYEEVRSLRIYEGTNDVHKAIIARECLKS